MITALEQFATWSSVPRSRRANQELQVQVGAFVHNLTSKPGYARRTSPLCHRKLDSSKAQRAMIHCSGNACLLSIFNG